jgi:hypothetical protein
VLQFIYPTIPLINMISKIKSNTLYRVDGVQCNSIGVDPSLSELHFSSELLDPDFIPEADVQSLSKLHITHELLDPGDSPTVKNLKTVLITLQKQHHSPHTLTNRFDQMTIDSAKKERAHTARMKATLTHDVRSHWYYTSLIQLAGGIPVGFTSRADEATAFADNDVNPWEKKDGGMYKEVALAAKILLEVFKEEGFYDQEMVDTVLQKFMPKEGELAPDITFDFGYTQEFRNQISNNPKVKAAIGQYNAAVRNIISLDRTTLHSLIRKGSQNS